MTTAEVPAPGPVLSQHAAIPPLENGDRLTRAEFERRYSAMPQVKKAELIEGVVYMPSAPALLARRDYVLTESDADVPTHYAFKVADRTEAIARDYERARAMPPAAARPAAPRRPRADETLRRRVRAALAALDAQGRWVEDGRLRFHGSNDPTRRILASQTFAENVELLNEYLAATRP